MSENANNRTVIKKAVILYDCIKEQLDKSWLSSSLREFYEYVSVEEIFTGKMSLSRIAKSKTGKLRLRFKLIELSFNAIRLTTSADHIYVWNNAQARVLHEICRVFHLKRNIISFLWYSPQNAKLDKIRRHCLEDPDFVALAITKKNVLRWKNEVPGANIVYFPDVYDTKDVFYPHKKVNERYVFSGGFTDRDWYSFLKIVKKCPDIKFKCIAYKKQWDKNWNIPSNLEVMFDTKSDFYYDCMKNAYLTITVVKDNKLSGIINIIKSIQYGIIPLVTLNESTQEHYPDEFSEYLISDIDDFIKGIYKIYNYSDTQYEEIINNLQSNQKENFSGKKYMLLLKDALDDIYNCHKGENK